MARYNPLSYHNGSVWPHDNSIISAGMAAYDFVKEANENLSGLIEASSAFSEHRLPELFWRVHSAGTFEASSLPHGELPPSLGKWSDHLFNRNLTRAVGVGKQPDAKSSPRRSAPISYGNRVSWLEGCRIDNHDFSNIISKCRESLPDKRADFFEVRFTSGQLVSRLGHN